MRTAEASPTGLYSLETGSTKVSIKMAGASTKKLAPPSVSHWSKELLLTMALLNAMILSTGEEGPVNAKLHQSDLQFSSSAEENKMVGKDGN